MIRRGSQVRVLSDPPFSNKFKLIVGLFFWDFLFFDICILGRTICNFIIDRALAELWPGSILQNFSENGFEISFVGFYLRVNPIIGSRNKLLRAHGECLGASRR